MNRRGFLASLATAFVARRLDFSAWAHLSPGPSGSHVLTLADLARRGGLWPRTRQRAFLEMLMQENAILNDIEWMEAPAGWRPLDRRQLNG